MEATVFYGFAGLTLIAALAILFTKNLLYAAFSLFLTFMGIAALYVVAGADFLGVSQIMIYVGGILVLIVFGVMLTQKADNSTESSKPNRILVSNARIFPGFLLAGISFLFLWFVTANANFRLNGMALVNRSTIKTLGVKLMTTHLLPFEIAGILLLVALVGAAYLAMNRNPTP